MKEKRNKKKRVRQLKADRQVLHDIKQAQRRHRDFETFMDWFRNWTH